jgi:collagenase-like PrtC family protease
MAGLEFSVPYNTDPLTLDKMLALDGRNGNRIKEVYLSGPQECSGSGRLTPELPFEAFAEAVGKIHDRRVRANVLLNSVCEGGDWYSPGVLNSTMDYVDRLHHGLGVEAVTIANPLYIREVRKRFPNLEICASVLGDIDCVQKAKIYKLAGAGVITPDVRINRDPTLLKKIRAATGTQLKLMVNEGCLLQCPFRKFHFNYVSHQSRNPDKSARAENNVFSANCVQVARADLSQVLKSGWIRPEDMRKYADVSTCFKIVGRTSSSSALLRTVEAYMQESWDGDLMELMAGPIYSLSMSYLMHLDNVALGDLRFFEKVSSCDRECYECTYCEEIAARLVKRGVFTREKVKDIFGGGGEGVEG